MVNPALLDVADIVWVTEKGDSCDPFTQDDAGGTPASQLLCRSRPAITCGRWLSFAKHFGKSPDKLGLNELRTYQAYLLRERKLTPSAL